MIATTSQFRSGDLRHLINAVPKYPISVKSLISIASRKKLSPGVINFYRAFPDTAYFANEDDMVERTKLLEMLHVEEEAQPLEDQVRGAED
jgi:hypothetical protein